MHENKNKIEEIIKEYIRHFPEEFDAFKKGTREKVDLMKGKFGETSEDMFITRALFDLPETLFNIFRMKLKEDEMDWLWSKEGSIWFAKKFKDFRVTEKI